MMLFSQSQAVAQVSLETLGPIVPWLAGASVAIFLVNQALTFFKVHIREQPTPADTYASKSDHAELKRRVDEISAEIRGGFEKLDHKRSVSIAGLHDDLKDAVKELRTEMKEDITGVHSRLSDIVAAIGELKGRIQK